MKQKRTGSLEDAPTSASWVAATSPGPAAVVPATAWMLTDSPAKVSMDQLCTLRIIVCVNDIGIMCLKKIVERKKKYTFWLTSPNFVFFTWAVFRSFDSILETFLGNIFLKHKTHLFLRPWFTSGNLLIWHETIKLQLFLATYYFTFGCCSV